MADQTEDKGGIGVSGVVGGIAGGVTAEHFANKAIATNGVKAVLAGKEPTESYTKLVNTVTGRVETLSDKRRMLNEARNIAAIAPDQIETVLFKEADKVHAMEVTLKDGVRTTITGISKLPEGVKAGEGLAADKAKALFEGEKAYAKTVVEQLETGLAKGVSKAASMVERFSAASVKGKALAVGAGALGAVAGGYALNAAFGGSHASKVEAERDKPTEATAGRS